MEELLKYIDIILLFLVVVFLFFMLRRFLGKNIGYSRESHLKKQKSVAEMNDFRAVNLGKETKKINIEYPVGSLAYTLSLIAQYDSDFEIKKFLDSAKKAFEIITTAFLKGNLEKINYLISAKVNEVFNENINNRKLRGEKIIFLLKSFLLTDIVAAKISHENIYITVKFVTDQVREEVRDNQAEDTKINFLDYKAKQFSESWVFYKNYKTDKSVWELIKITS